MNNNLKQLIELQKIDSKLLNIKESKGDLPIIVQNLTDQLENAKKETELRAEEIKEITSGINKETASVDDNNVKLKKLIYSNAIFTIDNYCITTRSVYGIYYFCGIVWSICKHTSASARTIYFGSQRSSV